MFGVFFEEINHAGSGGLWAELVSNRGFEAGGIHSSSSDILPWGVIGNESEILVSTDLSSPFEQNRVALRVEVLRDSQVGVGVYNPGFWGMNIEKGRQYKVIFYLRSLERVDVSVSFTTSNGTLLASTHVSPSRFLNWTRMEVVLTPKSSNSNSRLQFTTNQKGFLWFDQISAMPADTYKGHGFRIDVFQMIADLRPAFMRFPGGTFVEGVKLSNSFQWKKTVGPWEERPGHFGDVWNYWTDDGLGFFEQLLLAEDLHSEPVWVVNCGISRQEHANNSDIQQYVRDMLDGIEFARGDASSAWGSVRARMGHPQPFQLRYVAIGNEDCDFPFYRGNYLKFYKALKQAYPDIQAISNCDGRTRLLDHPADLFDYHIYTSPSSMFSLQHAFDSTPRGGPKVFVSEYAVNKDAGLGNLLDALAEAAFLMGVEKNSDIVSMVCYAPLLVNTNDRNWNPDALVVSSSSVYGTPSYWMQRFFVNSSGASIVSSNLQSDDTELVASVVSWIGVDNKTYLTVKVLNIGNKTVDFTITFDDHRGSKPLSGVSKTILTSPNVTDENTFQDPTKVHPVTTPFKGHGNSFKVSLPPYSLQAFDLSGVGKGHIDRVCLTLMLIISIKLVRFEELYLMFW
ncbi:alpha-L-arabinofuranosidase 1-like [Silene latifolia]|uniref:alpha-L-arabinofuranosidase 1-like n=1 Tax=Silene latifolia TaxID=37657 RepID=UPI003D78AF5C